MVEILYQEEPGGPFKRPEIIANQFRKKAGQIQALIEEEWVTLTPELMKKVGKQDPGILKDLKNLKEGFELHIDY